MYTVPDGLCRLQEYRDKVRANAQLADSAQASQRTAGRSIGAAEGPNMGAFLHQLGGKVRLTGPTQLVALACLHR